MTNEQTKTFFLTASRVREQNRIEALMKARRARAKQEARWRFSFKFRLLRYQYALHIHLAHNYCGAYAMTLHPRPGEDWLRGNDLRDGKFWRLPWVAWDILCYELRRGRWCYCRREVAEQTVNREIDWAGREARNGQWPPAEMLQEHPVRIVPPPVEIAQHPWFADNEEHPV